MLNEWQPKDKISASRLNGIIQGVNSVHPFRAGAGVNGSSMGNGMSLALDEYFTIYFSPEIGKIVDTGPEGQSDYTDYHYWIQLYENVNTVAENGLGGDYDLEERPSSIDGDEETKSIVTAFNLSEYDAATHTLDTSGTQWVTLLPIRCDQGEQAAPRVRYLIVSSASSGASGSGTYQGQLFQMVTDNQTGWDYLTLVGV